MCEFQVDYGQEELADELMRWWRGVVVCGAFLAGAGVLKARDTRSEIVQIHQVFF